MKTFEQLREELESISELSTALLKRYSKKVDDKIGDHLDKKNPTAADQAKHAKRVSGKYRAQDKTQGYAKVNSTGGPSSADNKKAKDVAHKIAAAHKDLRVSSHGNNHFIHHKDDEDGNEHVHVSHHSKGKVTVTHEYGTSTHKQKTLSHAAAVKHGHSIV